VHADKSNLRGDSLLPTFLQAHQEKLRVSRGYMPTYAFSNCKKCEFSNW